jgi:hypothetical protein
MRRQSKHPLRTVILAGAAASILVTHPDGARTWELATPGLVVARGARVNGRCEVPPPSRAYEDDSAHPAFRIRVETDAECVQRVRAVEAVPPGTKR